MKTSILYRCTNCRSYHDTRSRFGDTLPPDYDGCVAGYWACPECDVTPSPFQVPISFNRPPQRISRTAFLWIAGSIFLTIGMALTLAILAAVNW